MGMVVGWCVGPRALRPAKFGVYGHGKRRGPGASVSSGVSLQLRGREDGLACVPSSLSEIDEAGRHGCVPDASSRVGADEDGSCADGRNQQ